MCVHSFLARLSVTDEAQCTEAMLPIRCTGAGIETMALRFLALPTGSRRGVSAILQEPLWEASEMRIRTMYEIGTESWSRGLGCSPIRAVRELGPNVVRQFGPYLLWAQET
jgi:hypothetical protein